MQDLLTQIDEVSLAMKSQLAILAAHEAYPESEDYTSALDNVRKLASILSELVDLYNRNKENDYGIDIRERETKMKERELDLKERELASHEKEADARIKEIMAKIDELENRGDLEIRKLKYQLAGVGILLGFMMWWESKGHIVKDGLLRVISTARRVIPI